MWVLKRGITDFSLDGEIRSEKCILGWCHHVKSPARMSTHLGGTANCTPGPYGVACCSWATHPCSASLCRAVWAAATRRWAFVHLKVYHSIIILRDHPHMVPRNHYHYVAHGHSEDSDSWIFQGPHQASPGMSRLPEARLWHPGEWFRMVLVPLSKQGLNGL